MMTMSLVNRILSFVHVILLALDELLAGSGRLVCLSTWKAGSVFLSYALKTWDIGIRLPETRLRYP
jgi:hypothetical protein